MSHPRVLICDDSAESRAGLKALLEASGIDIVGEAVDGTQVTQAVARAQPDIVLMDLKMPGGGGIEATRLVLRECPHVGVVVLTMVQDDDAVFAAMRAGARGYLLKGARRAEIMHAITTVADGGGFFGSAIAQQLGISEKTVRNNVSSILTKLCVADRSQAIILARDAGLGSNPTQL